MVSRTAFTIRDRLFLPEARPSRRTVVRNLGGGALAAGLLAVGPVGRLAARETTADVAAPFFSDFLDDWATAAATGEAAPVLPYYAADSVLEDVPLGLTFAGPAEIEPFLVGFFANYSEASVTYGDVFATADHAVAEVTFAGKYTGQLPGLPAGTGQPLMTRSVHVYELGERTIKRQSLYFDAYGFLIQLGVLPAPGA